MNNTPVEENTPLLSSGTLVENRKRICFVAAVGAVSFVAVLLIRSDLTALFLNRTNDIIQTSNEPKASEFPQTFLWGAATSAYQIEGGASAGGRGPSIWDTFCAQSAENCSGDTGNVTADHFHHWQEDIEIMQSLGLKAYRFSISWSRILPTGTAEGTESGDHRYSKTKGINYDGVQFYNHIIDALLAKGIEPFVTLYHWDLPQTLQDRYGGWENEQIIDDFSKVRCLYVVKKTNEVNEYANTFVALIYCAKYARICFQFFGDRVKYWITINEAWSVAIGGYDQGNKAPGILNEEQGGTGKPYLIGHHLLLAHARAVGVYREEGYSKWYLHGNSIKTGVIGIANSGDYRFPVDPKIKDDIDAATRAMEFQLGWMVRLPKSEFFLHKPVLSPF